MNHEMRVMGPLLGWLVCSIAWFVRLLDLFGFLFAWFLGWLVGSLVGWLVGWLLGCTSTTKETLAWKALSTCVAGAVNTAEVEKVGTELRALKEKLKQEAQGKWDALHDCMHSFSLTQLVYFLIKPLVYRGISTFNIFSLMRIRHRKCQGRGPRRLCGHGVSLLVVGFCQG